jgi:hypothetical protein
VAHGISFRVTGASAAGACPIPKRRKPPDEAAFRRVASKGVYAGGGSIAEGVPERKFAQNSGLWMDEKIISDIGNLVEAGAFLAANVCS